VEIEPESLRSVSHALQELRERGQDRETVPQAAGLGSASSAAFSSSTDW
jgi:hypothetical protein